MLNDQPRTEAYRHAISANKAMFKDKVIIDVGAGTGVFESFYLKRDFDKKCSLLL